MLKTFLKNKTISVVAPAGKVNPALLNTAVNIWQSWGTKIKIMPHVTGFEEDFFLHRQNCVRKISIQQLMTMKQIL